MHHHYIDRFSHRDSVIHRLDPRAKILAVIAYSVMLISVGRYELPSPWYVIFPAVMLLWGGIPLGFVARHIAIVSPFILFVAVSSPIFDARPIEVIPGLTIRGGWFTALSILLRFILGMAALIALASTTRFPALLKGFEQLGVPRLLVTQLRFLYRYLFLLIEQAMHLRQARRARDAGRGPVSARWEASAGLVGMLFTRTMEQAERTHMAMLARGYDGRIRLARPLSWRGYDTMFLAATVVYLVLIRFAA